MIEKNQQTPQEEQVIVPQSPIDSASPKKSKRLFILLSILITLVILFMPIPFRYGIVFCKPFANMQIGQKCPQEGDIGWNPSIAQSLFIRLTQSGSGATETSYLTTPTPKPIPDPTANWKTYLNLKYRYEIRYPSDWSLKETPYGDFNGRTLFLPPNEAYKGPNDGSRGIAIDFRDANYSPPLPALPNYQTGYQKIRTVQVGSENVDVLEPNFQAAEKYEATIRNGKYEYIFYFGTQLDGKYDSVFDQILSTFKFLP